MKESTKSLLKYTVWIGLATFAVFYLIFKPSAFEEWAEYAGYTVTISTCFALIYEKWLWRWNPFEKTPRLQEKYAGTICYKYEGHNESKSIDITVKQSLLRIQVTTRTDMNSSTSISSAIVEEHGERVLYYQYITAPSLTTSRDNPMQYGASRMRIEGKGLKLRGSYWTDRQTRGDMIWEFAADN